MSDTYQHSDPYLDTNSIESRFRAKRFRRVQAMLDAMLAESGRVEILDLGGTEKYWNIARDFLDANRDNIHITLVNIEVDRIIDTEMFTSIAGDACDQELFLGRTFELVHSNSVIEHVGDAERIAAFAVNVRRLGQRYFIQTPDYWCPLEPHFRFPGFHWLPIAVRTELLHRFNLGFYHKEPNRADARAVVEDIRLLNAREMALLFPGASIEFETVKGIPKSIMAVADKRGAGLSAQEKEAFTSPVIAPRRAHFTAKQATLVPEHAD
jgi:hypothetical protein